MSAPRFAWVGFHAEGLPALEALLAAGAPIRAVLTLAPEPAAAKRGGGDYRPVCARFAVPLYPVANINDPAALEILRALAPDVVFVIGWPQLVRSAALAMARVGMIGSHASLLPQHKGRAPVNWALIRGETTWGNTLFWLDQDVFAGDIIDQSAFAITPYDTSATLYAKVAASTRDMLLRLLPRLLAGERPGRPQPRTSEPPLPRRRAADGRIAWELSAASVYDFVRALTRPYPGAFSWLDGRRWLVWHAALPHGCAAGAPPGLVLGPVVSPIPDACGQLVACGQGALIVLEAQGEDGEVMRGRALSELPWTGKRWGDAPTAPP